jgi:PAS domain-containing protein
MLHLFAGENSIEETVRFAEEVARYGLWQVDLATGRMTLSSNLYRLIGLKVPDGAPGQVDDVTFSTFEKVTHPDDLPVLAEIQHILAEGLPFERQFRVIHPNGRVRAMAIHGEVVVDASGRKSRAIGALMDVTTHVESVRASQVDSERVRNIMAAIDGRLWTARSDGFRTDLLLRGRSNTAVASNWLGFGWLARVHPDDVGLARATWADAGERKKSFMVDLRIRGDDGDYHWRRQYCSPILNDDGSAREWVGLSLLVNAGHIATDSAAGTITGAQIRAARGILNWSVRHLADRTGLSTGTLRRIEAHDGYNKAASAALLLIKDALSAAGVDFFVLPTGEAGVYPTRKGSRLKVVSKRDDTKKASA